MNVYAVIVEQHDEDGLLRTFRMQCGENKDLVIALADEYEEMRSGPFHFLDEKHEHDFESGFIDCRARRLSGRRLHELDDGRYFFSTHWEGIPAKEWAISYYALSLPKMAIPVGLNLLSQCGGHQLALLRDDQHQRFIVYHRIDARAGHTGDFVLELEYRLSPEDFWTFDWNRGNPHSLYDVDDPFGYEGELSGREKSEVNQFLLRRWSWVVNGSIRGRLATLAPMARPVISR